MEVLDNNKEHFILASCFEEAGKKYRERYVTEYDKPIVNWWNWGSDYIRYLDEENPNYKNEIVGGEYKGLSFAKLKEELRADEFLEYYRQEMYPIEIILKE